MAVDLNMLIEAMDEAEMRERCARCGQPKRKGCDDDGWLDAIGPKPDGSYITSRPCPNSWRARA